MNEEDDSIAPPIEVVEEEEEEVVVVEVREKEQEQEQEKEKEKRDIEIHEDAQDRENEEQEKQIPEQVEKSEEPKEEKSESAVKQEHSEEGEGKEIPAIDTSSSKPKPEKLEAQMFANGDAVHVGLSSRGLYWSRNRATIDAFVSSGNLLGAQALPTGDGLRVTACYPKETALVKQVKQFVFTGVNRKRSEEWARAILCVANGLPIGTACIGRRLLVVINPFGGTGAALKIWRERVKPLLLIAGLRLDVRVTECAGHAIEIGGRTPLDEIDGVVTVSGDGLLHEVVNGMLGQPNWRRAMQIPVLAVPAGSGNGLAWTLGLKDAVSATYAVIKGASRPLDAFSVVQKGIPRKFGFLSFNWVYVADTDLGSERMRWMGATRFLVSGVYNMIVATRRSGKVMILPDMSPTPTTTDSGNLDKAALPSSDPCLAGPSCERCERRLDTSWVDEVDEGPGGGGPRLRHVVEGNRYDTAPGWETLDETSFQFFLASNVSAIGKENVFTPQAHTGDGALHLMYVGAAASRAQMTGFLTKSFDGTGIADLGYVHQRRVRALYLDPDEPTGPMGLDGEHVPPGPVYLEIHPHLLRVFCMPK